VIVAIDTYAKMLATRNAVGLFYFAGHGTQLAWRNYLLPVDAEIRTLDDIPARGVALNSLLQGLTLANGSSYDAQIEYRVVARENVSLPAGVFDAFRVEGTARSQGEKFGVNVYNLFWITSEVRRVVAHETKQRFANGKLVKHERAELTAYVQR
jgi:hypothetical protein